MRCALVNKKGACYQCRALRELAPPTQRGPPLPTEPMSFDERMGRVARAARGEKADQRLTDYFFAYTDRMQQQR